MNSEQTESDENGRTPSLSRKNFKEAAEIQDVYRRTLTASWGSHGHELPADQCIEDIFAGGDGWGKFKNEEAILFPSTSNDEDAESESETLRPPPSNPRRSSIAFSKRGHGRQKSSGKSGIKSPSPSTGERTSSHSSDLPTQSSSSDDHKKRHHRRANEYSELELREDLRSWQINPSRLP